MLVGQSALEIHDIWFSDRSVGAELDAAALHEGARRHDDLAVVPGHRPRDGIDIAVHGRGGLNALAERDHALSGAELHRLNDIVAALRGVRHAPEAQPLIEIRREDRALERARRDGRGEEEALIQRGHESQIRADLLPQSRGAQTVGAALHEIGAAADIAADGREPAAGVFDERAHDQIRPHVRGLDALDELAVAVVHHADDVGLCALAERDQLPDLLHRKRRARGVALGALDRDELCPLIDRALDGWIVERTVGL